MRIGAYNSLDMACEMGGRTLDFTMNLFIENKTKS